MKSHGFAPEKACAQSSLLPTLCFGVWMDELFPGCGDFWQRTPQRGVRSFFLFSIPCHPWQLVLVFLRIPFWVCVCGVLSFLDFPVTTVPAGDLRERTLTFFRGGFFLPFSPSSFLFSPSLLFWWPARVSFLAFACCVGRTSSNEAGPVPHLLSLLFSCVLSPLSARVGFSSFLSLPSLFLPLSLSLFLSLSLSHALRLSEGRVAAGRE